MKVSSRAMKVAAAVLATIMIAGLGFLFLTTPGLQFQWGIAARGEHDLYKRVLLHIGTSRKTPGAFHFAAAEFSEFARKDLMTARQMADGAIQLRPNEASYYMSRGLINMQAQHYAEAKTDFQMGLYCWKDDWGRPPSQGSFTNAIIKATRYLQTWESVQRDSVSNSLTARINSGIQEFPNNPNGYWSRGHRRMLEGRYAEAKTDFEAAVRHWQPGIALYSQEEFSNALVVATGYLEASHKVAEMRIDDSTVHPPQQ